MSTDYLVKSAHLTATVTLLQDLGDRARVRVGDREFELHLQALPDGRWAVQDGQTRQLLRTFTERGELVVVDHSTQHRLEVVEARSQWLRGAAGAKGHGGGAIKASMPGRVVRLPVQVGDEVAPGGVVAVLEAMKMENDVRSPGGGIVKAVAVQQGQAVEAGQLLVTLEAIS